MSSVSTQNFAEIALSLTVFEINDIFHFHQNMAGEIQESQNFSDVTEE